LQRKETALKVNWLALFLCAFGLVSGCAMAGSGGQGPKVSILVDLDPASADRTVIVESLIADQQGRLYTADWVSGNILRVDPKAPKPVVVGRIPNRQIEGKSIRADGRGIAFNQQGDLFVACDPFNEVVRLKRADINPEKPGVAETFATGTAGANGIAFDRQGNLYVSGARTGRVYRVGPAGGAAEVSLQIEPHTRTLPDGKTQQPIVANGLIFDNAGALYIADTARGAIWKAAISADGNGSKPNLLAQSPLLEGADGFDFDRSGKLWVIANERNAIVTVTADGKVQEIAKNGSEGPLEFPTAIVFVGDTGYISNNDTPRRDNVAADGKTSLDGIGASIAQITP
jgi:sugar lactone lactonase YvrE